MLQESRAGRGGAVLLLGEAGLGKTAVLDWARQHAGADLEVRSARGSVMETDLPLAFAEQFLDSLSEDRRAAPGAANDPLGRRAWVHEVARAEVRRWAESGPQLILLDDLHWSDPDSISVVGFLCRRLSHLPVGIIGTLRPWPPAARAAVELLAREPAAQLLTLRPLSASVSSQLLCDLVGTELGDDVRQQAWDLTGGNPLLVSEAARSFLAEGGLPAPGTASLLGLQRALLLSHLVGLSASALDVAGAASVLGGRFRLSAVQAVAEQSTEVFTEGFDTLVAAGVVHEVAGGAELSHDLLASALYDDMAPARRKLLHRRAFLSYLGQRDSASATPHALAAGLVGDEQAVAAATDAGERAIRDGALQTGVTQLEAAVSLAGAEPPVQLLEALADALFAASRPAAALEVLERALRLTSESPARTRTMLKVARAEAYAGRFDAALAIYDQLASRMDDLASEGAVLVAERAHVIWEREGPGAALGSLRAGRKLLANGGSLDPIESYFRLQTGDPGGLAVLEQAATAARERLTAAPEEAMATFNVLPLRAGALAHTEHPDEALALINQGCDWLRNAGALRATIPLRNTRIGILINQAKLVEALAEIEDVEEELELDALLQPHLEAFRAVALAHLGRLEEAEAVCEATAAMAGSRAFFVVLLLGMARGQLHLARGRPEAASDVYRRVEGQVRAFGIGEPCGPRWSAGAIEAALAAGRLADVQRVVDWLWEHSAVLPCQWPRMIALAGEAGLLGAAGDDERADERYQEALAFPPVGPLERVAILLRYGSWLRRRNHRLRARPILAEALEMAEAQGTALSAATARAELAAAGGRRRRRRERSELTVQEARVARIAVSGATTREIAAELHLSPRTVESHLGHVYLKLGVSSKRELRQHRDELERSTDTPC